MYAESSAQARRMDDAEEAEREAGRTATLSVVPEGAAWNAVEQAIFQRRSIRKYRKAQVPAHLIRRMLEAGRFAPSQGNCQPWKFIVLRDPEMIQGIEDFCVGQCKKLSQALDYASLPPGTLKYRITRAKAKLFNRFQPSMMHPVPVTAITAIGQGRFTVFHHAPTVILLLMDKRGIGVPPVDIGICGTNMVLAAQSFGLGTCWIGFSKFLNESREWCARLGIEEPYELSEAIAVGYPVGDPTRLIARDTHATAWFEDGKKTIIY